MKSMKVLAFQSIINREQDYQMSYQLIVKLGRRVISVLFVIYTLNLHEYEQYLNTVIEK